jgi:hypothetical protein
MWASTGNPVLASGFATTAWHEKWHHDSFCAFLRVPTQVGTVLDEHWLATKQALCHPMLPFHFNQQHASGEPGL